MSIISTAKMTARQFLELGEDPVGVRLELVNGEVAVSPSATPSHSYTEKSLGAILVNYVKANSFGQIFGDVDTIFGENDVRRPDLIYFSKDRLHLIGEKAMEGPPDLCVEIISPSSRTIDRKHKFKQYAEGKVAYYWIIDPEARAIDAFKRSGRIYRLIGGGRQDEMVQLAPFPDLSIPLAELWWPGKRR